MKDIEIVERDMTKAEMARMLAGFDEQSEAHGNPLEKPERLGFVALDGKRFAGCVSGLAYRSDAGYARWFTITDLFVESPIRRQGLGAALLDRLEERVAGLGIANLWAWTAGYEAPGFYEKQGYEVFCELESYYASGHARVGVRKALEPRQASV